jgi:hypothetical protein
MLYSSGYTLRSERVYICVMLKVLTSYISEDTDDSKRMHALNSRSNNDKIVTEDIYKYFLYLRKPGEGKLIFEPK